MLCCGLVWVVLCSVVFCFVVFFCVVLCGLCCVVWVWLSWDGLCGVVLWVGLGGVVWYCVVLYGLGRVGLGCVALCGVVWCCVGWFGLGWVVLCCVVLSRVMFFCVVCVGLDWVELDCVGLDWIGLGYIVLCFFFWVLKIRNKRFIHFTCRYLDYGEETWKSQAKDNLTKLNTYV